MAITIYTYSNPYKINKEPYWASIHNCFQLCVSQTLVNGMCDQYNEFFNGKLTTINKFINVLYENWESDAMAISQRAAIDNVIEYLDFKCSIGNYIDCSNVVQSLKRNRSYVLESIRNMFELGMDPDNIKVSKLTYEQKCVVEIYRELKRTGNKFFILKDDFTEEDITNAIANTINSAIGEKNKNELKQIRNDSVIIHGIHQFSPIMLKTIEILSKYKLVVILFNYQSDYKSVYQTWLDVYSSFESKVVFSPKNLNNDSQNYAGGKVADNIASLIGGNTASIDFTEYIEVTEFDNATEFSGYVAKIFETAEKTRRDDGYKHPTLYYMDEQFYSANSNVNNILKIYFPEQFGERDFLDYPIGHFFLSITNMWDPETQSLNIKDLQDLFECLSCGIIVEKRHGEVISIFDKCKLFFLKETTISGIIKKLQRLRKRIDELEDDEYRKEILRIEYFNVNENEINSLINSLTDLNKIIKYFYEDFNEQKNDFKKFYKKISEVLITRVLEVQDIDEEFKDIVERVLCRLNEVNDVEANASFDCLKETMQLYLQQIPNEGKGANWIVRNFEQIDGDVLRKNAKKNNKTYHFACLSDQDMSITHKDEFPWPLDINFFEVAQAPVDWKYQVFVTSRLEYKNFRRYALVYGLAFSKCSIKLSYIKNQDNGISELYYLLKILNAKVKIYEPEVTDGFKKIVDYIRIEDVGSNKFSKYDLMKYRLCSYRFLIESIIEGRSVYKDEFLLRKYLTVVLEHRVRNHFSGHTYIKNIVYDYLNEQMDDLKSKFVFINHADTIDIIRSSINYIEKYAIRYGKFAQIKENEVDHMIKRENFLTVKFDKESDANTREIFKNSTQEEINDILNMDKLSTEKYRKTLNELCVNCAEKDICLEIFKTKKK